MEAKDVREMVLATGATLAHRVVAAVDAGELEFGQADDTVEVGGTNWTVTANYYSESGFVRIMGSPILDEEHGPHPFLRAFAMSREDDGSFMVNLPEAWLPAHVVEAEVVEEPEAVGR